MNVSASQSSCEAKFCGSKGGKCPCPPAGACSCELVVCAAACRAIGRLQREQQQKRDQQGEDSEGLRHGEPEDEVAELALCGRGVAQGGGKIVAEDGAYAYACAAHTDAGDAGTDHFCS